jgi:hypothetical protein
VRETIPGHRFTDTDALPINVQVLRYEKADYAYDAWGDAASLNPSAGLLFAVFSGPAGSVAVLSEVLTLDVQYEPDDTCGCCLPDGTCPLLTWTDCLTQEGTPSLLGPIGDLDGDGCDDACIYPPERYTMVMPLSLLSAEDIEAADTFESVLRELAGFCSGPVDFGPQPPEPPQPSATRGVDCSDPVIQLCIAQYQDCLNKADRDYWNTQKSAMHNYNSIVMLARIGLVAALAACFGSGPFAPLCQAAAAAAYAATVTCATLDYRTQSRSNRANYCADVNACYNTAQAGGCLDCLYWPT